MNLKHLFSRQTINNISRLNGKTISPYPYIYENVFSITTTTSPSISSPNDQESTPCQSPKHANPIPSFNRCIHYSQRRELSASTSVPEHDPEETEGDEAMNEFLSRFVWIMRHKLSEVYSDCDKKTIDGMLLIFVVKVVSEMEKRGLEQMLGTVVATPSHDFTEDLWKTVWEVSNEVLVDMQKAKKKEKMKGFLQSEEVKEMYRFAGEVGIRGEMSREMRFKWAREKMEASEFYQNLERLCEENLISKKRRKQFTQILKPWVKRLLDMILLWMRRNLK